MNKEKPPSTEENKIEELRAIRNAVSEENPLVYISPEISAFYKEMQAKYSLQELTNAKLWHLIIGSTYDNTDTGFDLPGGEVEEFIRNKLPKIEQVELDI